MHDIGTIEEEIRSLRAAVDALRLELTLLRAQRMPAMEDRTAEGRWTVTPR